MTELICPVCKVKSSKEIFSGNDYVSGDEFVLVGCGECKIVITNFDHEGKGIGDYYGEHYYGNRKSLSENLINRLRLREVFKITNTKHFAPTGALLDVGCGNGSFLMKLRDKGWKAFGTELAPPEHLKNNAGDFIYKGDLLENNFDSGSFEFLTMWHSLEHIRNPLEYIKDAWRILKDDGYFIAEVPNFDSWQAKIFKENWFHLDVPRHLLHLTPNGLTILLQKAGFKDVNVKSGSFIYQFYGWLQSIFNVFNKRKNILFDLLNGKVGLNKILKEHTFDAIIDILFFVPAVKISFILSILEILAGKSGIILVSARK